MKYILFFIITSLISLSVFAITPCGEHELEQQHASLIWNKFIDIGVRSRFVDVDAIICVGKVSGSPVASHVSYRDADNRTLILKEIEELEEFQVLITSADLPGGISRVARSGDLVSLRISEPLIDSTAQQARYPVSVRFHRALARGAAADIRQIDIEGVLDLQEKIWGEKEGKIFNQLRIYVSALPPRMEQIILKLNETTQLNYFTSQFDRVDDLTK